MKLHTLTLMIAAALSSLTFSARAETRHGPSTATAPYVLPIAPGVDITSILTTGDNIHGYVFGGIPDGLGAYDNEDGTMTVLVNHEIFADANGPLGLVRSHGGKGAYVSEWVINKKTLEVISGADLMKSVYQMGPLGWELLPAAPAVTDPSFKNTLGKTNAFARFCSADLADRKAFYNAATKKGTKARIFLNGEESGPTYQRGLAHVVTGPNKGKSFVLPWAVSANASWENFLANPHSGDRTVVIGNADGGTNGIYVYVGDKSNVGNEVERAGLLGGTIYRVSVNANKPETQAADAGLGLLPNARGNFEGRFTLVPGTDTTNAASTRFLRPEDGAWDTRNRNRYFFNTTDTVDAAKEGLSGGVGRTRVWALNFVDSSKPELGGTIEMMLDGTSAKGDYQMLDNMAVLADGNLILQEDVGNNAHNGKMWHFNPKTGELVKLAGFDPELFGDRDPASGTITTGTLTADEETSGVIDVTALLDREDDKRYALFVAQNHKASNDPATLEGGQLLLMALPGSRHEDGEGHEDGHHGKH